MTQLPPSGYPFPGARRSRRVVPVVLLVAVGLALYFLLPRKPDTSAAKAQADEEEVLSRQRTTTPSFETSARPPIVELPAVPEDQRTARVPPSPSPIEFSPETQVLVEEFVPGTTDWEEVPLAPGSTSVIRFMPKRYNVIVPAPIVMYLEVVDKNRKSVPVKEVQIRLRSLDKADDADASWTTLVPADDGKGEDTLAGDGRFTATLAPNGETQKRLLGHVLAEALVVTMEGTTRTVPGGLIYTKGPRARLTGVWRDRLEEGHLILEADVEVEEAGRFSLMAQVVGPQPGREAIALSRDLYRQLPAGSGTMVLKVWGKAFHDPRIDGPYQVVNVLLTRDLENTDYEPSVTVPLAHVTKPYKHSDFSAESYVASAPTEEDVGPNHPSQRDKPPALVSEEERNRLAAGTP